MISVRIRVLKTRVLESDPYLKVVLDWKHESGDHDTSAAKSFFY